MCVCVCVGGGVFGRGRSQPSWQTDLLCTYGSRGKIFVFFGPPFCCRYFRGCSVRHFAVATSVAFRSAILLSPFPCLFDSPFCCCHFRVCSVHHFAGAISVTVRSAILLLPFPWLFGPPFCCRHFRGCHCLLDRSYKISPAKCES